MGFGSTISSRLSVAGSSNYEPSHRSTSTRSTNYPPTVDSRTTKASTVRSSTVTSATAMSKFMRSASPPPSMSSTRRPPSYASRTSEASKVRASTVTSATSMSKLMRSASTSREKGSSASTTSTLRPPSNASRSSRASTLRASTHTAATSTSKLMRSASTASTASPQPSTPATSTTSLVSSKSKRNPSFLSTAASRLLWGRPPPGHSTLQPSQIASLTHTLSLPIDTPIYSSLVGALGLPLSRSQFSPVPTCFCDAHFWFERKYIDELTQVIAHELGPQLDKLRLAPDYLLSKRTARLLSTLKPYQELFPSSNLCPSDTSSILSTTTTLNPSTSTSTCPACTLHHLFHSPPALPALTLAAKSRKHHARPWPASIAWLDPCPGKGIDWEAKWRAESKFLARDRVRVQRWRRDNPALVDEGVSDPHPASQQIVGHQPGEGCDFCDGLRLEREDEEELDAVIAEEEEEKEEGKEEDERAASHHRNNNDDARTTHSTSPTLRAIEEENIIKSYLSPSNSSLRTSSIYQPCAHDSPPTSNRKVDTHHDQKTQTGRSSRTSSIYQPCAHDSPPTSNRKVDTHHDQKTQPKRASEWARSYQQLVPYPPTADSTTCEYEQFASPFASPSGMDVMVGNGDGGGWF